MIDNSGKISNGVDFAEESLEFHRRFKGKIAMSSKVPLRDRNDLSLAYTPGVAEACREIVKRPDESWNLTSRGSWVAVITDGSAVLGLGNIGPAAGMPVMEGKCVIFKEFADLDAFPFALKTQDVDRFVETVKLLSLSFGGVNLEDIAAPRCFEIEERLKKELDIPVMHDDQHGTAIVVMAALINAAKVVTKNFKELKTVIVGAGAAGNAIAALLVESGVRHVVVLDRKGIIGNARMDLTGHKLVLAQMTAEVHGLSGGLKEALTGADAVIGVSGPGILTAEHIRLMADKAIVFALANPIPEIMPEEAKRGGAMVIATGRSDFPNQINNALAYPGVFKGVLEARRQGVEGLEEAFTGSPVVEVRGQAGAEFSPGRGLGLGE
mgnify:CR=1 FL=1